ncbi:MAG: hypothetical protein GY850_31885 [bacterium]|nr:hypothetical protein [bacterium]
MKSTQSIQHLTVDRRVNLMKFVPSAKRTPRNDLVKGPKIAFIDDKALS